MERMGEAMGEGELKEKGLRWRLGKEKLRKKQELN